MTDANASLPPTPQFSRRALLRRGAAGAVAAGLGVGGYAWRIEPHWIETVEREMPLAELPERLCGRRIVQLSDLHVGPIVDHDYISAAVAGVERLRPDLIVITGDFMTCHDSEQIDQTLDVLASLPPAPMGCFGVLGNHDYGDRWRNRRTADKLCRGLQRFDVRMLRNECAEVEGLQVVGFDDLYSGEFEPARALVAFDRTRPGLALCHNPDSVDQPAMDHFRGWVLAGHTHGGQCKPPWVRPPVLPVFNPRYTSGEIALSRGRRLYINRGLGYTHRVRFNCRPEVTVFTLTRPSDEPVATA